MQKYFIILMLLSVGLVGNASLGHAVSKAENVNKKEVSQEQKAVTSTLPSTNDKPVTTKKISKAALPNNTAQSSGIQTQATQVNVDQFSGAANLAFPIQVPTGRAGIQPNLNISYNSGSRQLGLAGVGWTLDVPYIQLSTKKGLPKYDSSDQYVLNMGTPQELVSPNGRDGFKLKHEGSFINIERVNHFWRLTDQKGSRYFFGESEQSRVFKSDEPHKVAKWMLNRVEDINGNSMHVYYDNVDGTAYPDEFQYTGNVKTNEASFATVKITYKSSRHASTSYIFGFKSEINKIIDTVSVKVGNEEQNKYILHYEHSSDTDRDLLGSIEQIGKKDTTLPVVKFSYTTIGTPGIKTFKETPWNINDNTDLTANAKGVRFWDINSDGFIDLIRSELVCDNKLAKWNVYLNNKQGEWQLDNNAYIDHMPSFYNKCNTKEEYEQSNGFFQKEINEDQGVRILDINGDGLADILHSFDGDAFIKVNDLGQNDFSRVLRSGYIYPDGFIKDTVKNNDFRLTPNYRGEIITNTEEIRQKLLDAMAVRKKNSFYLNDGHEFKDSSVGLPDEDYISKQRRIFTVQNGGRGVAPITIEKNEVFNQTSLGFGDINGDGLQDLVKTATQPKVYLNRSHDDEVKFESIATDGFLNSGNYSRFTILADANGDGLGDIVNLEPLEEFVDINIGGRFIHAIDNYNAYTKRLVEVATNDRATIAADMNGDGLLDIVRRFSSGNTRFYINTGDSWYNNENWNFTNMDYSECSQFIDVNGDGLTDVYNFCDNQRTAYLNPGNKVQGAANVIKSSGPSDMLFSIDNGVGAKTEITYNPSTGTEYQNQFLPFPLYVVKQIDTTVVNPNLPNQATSTYNVTYEYRGGLWDGKERDFRGFKEVKSIDADGNYSITEFLQGEYTKGRPLMQANYDKEGKLFSKVTNQWEEQVIDESLRSKFVYLKRSDSVVYDGNATGKRTAQESLYEQNPQRGGLTKAISYGEVDLNTGADIGSDTLITETFYVANPANNLYNLPRQTIVKDKTGRVLRQNWLYYDYNDDNLAAPLVGRLTAKKDWVGSQSNAQHPITRYTYDVYGNLLTTTDPKGNVTTITYDAKHHLFPVQIENALHQSSKTFYYGINEQEVANHPLNSTQLFGLWGQVKAEIDSNNQSTWKHYDGLGRAIKMYGPNGTLDYPIVENQYFYAPTYLRVISKSRVKDLTEGTIDTASFYDGLGRLIEQKAPSHRANEYVVSSQTVYNQRGLPIRKHIPFYTNNNLDVIDEMRADLPFSSVEYDALGRIVRSIALDKSYSSIVYDDWTVVFIDNNGHKQLSQHDAYGRLKSKTEYTGADGRDSNYPSSSYTAYATTTWNYDLTGQLTATVDALGNTVRINYDALGRKISMQDPNMGSWQYQYDLNGNLTRQIDNKGQSIYFDYDALNRVKGKSSYNPFTTPVPPVAPPVSVSYTYEDPAVAFSQGRLTKASYNNDYAKFEYDNRGREITSTKNIDEANYTVKRDYDDLNRLVKLQYPNGVKVYYGYYPNGQAKYIAKVPTPVNNDDYYVESIDYEATGSIKEIVYGNGVKTTNIYDPQTLKLNQVNTESSKAGTLQNFFYTYDAIGQVMKIDDRVHTATQAFKYDAFNRLIEAAGSYGVKRYAYDQIGNIKIKDNLMYGYQFTIDGNVGIGNVGIGNVGVGNTGIGPHAVKSLSDGTRFGYDPNGNMSVKLKNKDRTEYIYDAENRLRKVYASEDGKPTKYLVSEYFYDGDGGRVKKKVYRRAKLPNVDPLLAALYSENYNRMSQAIRSQPTEEITTVYVGNVAEVEGNRTTDFIYLGSQRIASVSGDDIYFYHTDHLGGLNVLSDKLGNPKELTEYDPFGQVIRHDKYGTDIKTAWYYFTGKPFDEESGLYYYGARYYDPKLGRFITADTIVGYPSDPQSFNRYSYCHNNPVNMVDPSGHKSWWKKAVEAISGFMGIVGVLLNNTVSGDWSQTGRQIAVAVVSATAGYLTGGIGTLSSNLFINIAGHAIIGAAAGAVSGGITSIISGGTFVDGAKMGAIAGGIGGAIGGVTSSQQYKNWRAGNGFKSNAAVVHSKESGANLKFLSSKNLPDPLNTHLNFGGASYNMAGFSHGAVKSLDVSLAGFGKILQTTGTLIQLTSLGVGILGPEALPVTAVGLSFGGALNAGGGFLRGYAEKSPYMMGVSLGSMGVSMAGGSMLGRVGDLREPIGSIIGSVYDGTTESVGVITGQSGYGQ